MNLSFIAQFVLQQAFSLVEEVVKTEGPAVAAWIEAKWAALKKQYNIP